MDYFDILLARKLNGGGKNAIYKQTLSNLPSPIATFTGADAPIDSLKASIVGVQSGSGEPSPTNVRPIHGWDSGEVGDFAKNLYNSATRVEGYFIKDNGLIQANADSCYSAPIIVKSGSKITWSGYTTLGGGKRLHAYDKNGQWISRIGFEQTSANMPYTITATIPNGCFFVKISMLKTDTDVQVEFGNQTTYEPYNGNTYTITFKDSSDNPLTVYYGYIDISNGKLIVTHVGEFYDGSSDEDWGKKGKPNQYFRITVADAGTYVDGSIKCNQFEYANVTNDNTNIGITVATVGNKQVIGARPSNYLDLSLEDWKTMLATNPLQVIYELVTPLEYDLTPIAIRSNGVTNISVDCGEVTELKYYSETP